MTPYVTRYISRRELALFRVVEKTITRLPDINFGTDRDGQVIFLSCHILARAVGEIFGLKVCDGKYFEIFDHSWNITPEGNLLDVYPVAALGGPILHDFSTPAPASRLFVEKKLGKVFKSEVFLNRVRQVRDQMEIVVATNIL